MIGIYKIINNINNKCYIGQSIDIYTRWKQHIYEVKHPRIHNKIYNAIRKYGLDNFSFEVVEECKLNHIELDNLERKWIEYYNSYDNGYNSTRGGQGEDNWTYDPEMIKTLWDEGYSCSEIRDLLGCSQSLINLRLNEYKDYNKETSYNRGITYAKTIGKIGTKIIFGVPYYISIAQKELFIDAQVPVYQYSLLGEYISSFPSYAAAAKTLNLNYNSIRAAANKKDGQKTAGGFQWSLEKVDRMLPVSRARGKVVQCLETNEIFSDCKEAAKFAGLINGSHINDCCNGKRASAGKHPITKEKLHWKYI